MLLAAVCFISTCGGSPAAPSQGTISRPLVLSGQSNALLVEPFLKSVYPQPVLTVAENGRAIEGWSTGPSGNHWKELAPLLQQPIQAFVWWQGESDRDNANYLNDLQDLIARVRLANNNPRLLVIEVRVLNLQQNDGVRAAQEAFVRTDTNAVLVSSDGFQEGASDHLSDIGYQTVSKRILDAAKAER
jgi:hypothetical protein